jgi:hypothetical protein
MQDRQGGRRPYRGRRPSAARVRFLELLDSGMRPLEASREVGVNERTGRDWAKGIVKSKNRRYTFDGVLVWEAPGRPKPPREERVISARFLSIEQRIEIADLHQQGLSRSRIAERLSRSPSTISRELRRNAHPGSGDYRPWAAHRRAARRRATEARQAGSEPAASGAGRPRTGSKMEPGTDLQVAAAAVPRSAGDARDARDDLSGPLCPGPGRVASRAGPVSAHRARRAQTSPQARPAPPTVPVADGDDQRACRRGRGPGRAWALAGRSCDTRSHELSERTGWRFACRRCSSGSVSMDLSPA